ADLFHALLTQTLGPLAEPTAHTHAFYKGLRLVGIDGTTWSVSNTPPIKSSVRKTRSRRGSAAFYKLGMTALYELGPHNPLAARIGKDRESEMALAVPLLDTLHADWLLIADRYYGVAKFVSRLLALPSKPHFLVRARDNLKRKVIERFCDGSCLIEIREAATGTRVLLREIYARVRCRSGRWVSVRLWTNLLNPHTYPAGELVRLYGRRWEHETAYRQIKLNLRRSPLLLSHTLTTATQEICCLVLAQTIVARIRLSAAGKEHPLLQISFIQTLHLCRSFWAITAAFRDLLPPELLPLMFRRVLRYCARWVKSRRWKGADSAPCAEVVTLITKRGTMGAMWFAMFPPNRSLRCRKVLPSIGASWRWPSSMSRSLFGKPANARRARRPHQRPSLAAWRLPVPRKARKKRNKMRLP
ncbi:MAG: transposase, partial [Kiritimatiellia bacterium]